MFLLAGKGLDEHLHAFSTVFAAVMANFLGKYHGPFIMTSGTAVHEVQAVEMDDLVFLVIVDSRQRLVNSRVIPAAMISSSS